MTYIPSVREVNEDSNYVYLKGDADTDGSLRFRPDATHDGEHIEPEYRTNGVWNPTGFDLTGGIALNIGEGLILGAAGAHINTHSAATGAKFLHARTEYSDSIGTAEAAVTPTVEPLVTRSIQQPDNSGSFTGTTISGIIPVPENRFLTKIYLEVTEAATDNVTLNVRSDDAEGALFFTQRYGQSVFAVGEAELELIGWINEEGIGTKLYFEVVVDNSGTVGLATNVGLTLPWYAFDFHSEDHQHLAPMEFTNDAMITDHLSFDLVLTTDGDPLYLVPTLEL